MNKKIKNKHVEAFIKDFPNSVVADMLLYFGEDFVVKFVELYSGMQIDIPTVKSIWTSYRNRVIVSELDNENSKRIRTKLADNFGIVTETVSVIYSKCKEKKVTRVRHRTVGRIADIIFRKNAKKYYKRVTELTHGASSDSMQNPEILYLIDEEKGILIKECMEDLNQHLVICDREEQRDKAMELILKKCDEDI